ncbi:MAG: Crp/Fnr family transcriptional regulator [Wenzhouxiangellaceae bacterium]
MDDSKRSCIVSQFQQFAELNGAEKALLQELEQSPVTYAAGDLLAEAGLRSEYFFTIVEGWVCAERTLEDGRCQVLDLFTPGQIAGLREITFHSNLCDFRALTPVVACPFPRKQLNVIFDQVPRLGDLLFLVLAREQSMLVERVINIGRRNAAERLAHFLVEIKARLHSKSDVIELPMTQSAIGDALSLSAVHVSRTFQQLCELGLISKDQACIRIMDLEALIEFGGFERAYLQVDAGWARTQPLNPAA